MNGIFFFGMLNALINPLIYGAFHIRDAAIQTIHTHKITCIATKSSVLDIPGWKVAVLRSYILPGSGLISGLTATTFHPRISWRLNIIIILLDDSTGVMYVLELHEQNLFFYICSCVSKQRSQVPDLS